MYRSLCWLLIACVLLLTVSFTCNIPLGSSPLATVAHAQTTVEKVSGYCERGGQKVTTAGQTSTTTVQKSYPSCTVTVYRTGTSTLQTIYSNSSYGVKSNPFTADANGYFEFYSSVAQRLDVQLSGGTAPNNITTPFFWRTDLALGAASPLLGVREAINVKRDYNCAGDGSTNDTTCIANALTAAQASGAKLVYFPSGTYMTDPITASLADIVIEGDGSEKTTIKGRQANQPVINVTGENYAVNVNIHDLAIEGQGATSGSGGHCIYINDASPSGSGVAQSTFKNLKLFNCGGKGMYIPRMFNVLIEAVVVDHVGGNGFELHGSNTTTLLRTYVKTLDGANTSAYRFYAGTPTLIGANGIDGCPNGGCDWGVMGRTVADDGVESYVRLNCTNCNIEDFKNRGIYFKYYSSGNFFNTSFYAPTSGTVRALKYDYVDDTIQGIFDGQSSIVTQGASWTNGYPIHSNANPFHSFSITANPYNKFWNGTDAQSMPQWGYQFASGISRYLARSTGLAADLFQVGTSGLPTGYQSFFKSTATGNIGLAIAQITSQTAPPFVIENDSASPIFRVTTTGALQTNVSGGLAFTVQDTSANALFRAARSNAWADSTASSFAQLGGSGESGWISGLNAATLPRLGVTATKTQITDTDTGTAPAPGSALFSLYKTTSANTGLEIKTSSVQAGDIISYHNSSAIKFKVDASGYATTERLRLSNVAGDPSSPANGDIAYNSTAGKFRCYQAGAWTDCIGSGGGGSGSVTSVALAAGTSGSDVNVSGSPITSSGTITLNIPDASGSARGLITTGSQTIAGAKTLSSTLTTTQINPSADNMYSFGTSALRWAEVHVGPSSLYVRNDNTNTAYGKLGFSSTTFTISSDAATPLQILSGSHGLAMSTAGVVTAVGTGGISAAAVISGTLGLTRGGTGQGTWAANEVLVGTGTNTGALKTLPSCSNATTSKLLYDNSTQTFSCGTDQTSGGGSSLPVVDTTSIIKGSVDASKEVRFEVDGLTTGTVRVITVPDVDGTLAYLTASQTLTNKTLGSGTKVTLGSDATYDTYFRDGSGNLTRLANGGTNYLYIATGSGPTWSGNIPAISGGSTITSTYVTWAGSGGALEASSGLTYTDATGTLKVGDNLVSGKLRIARAGGSNYAELSTVSLTGNRTFMLPDLAGTNYLASASTASPSNGCAQWASGVLTSTGAACPSASSPADGSTIVDTGSLSVNQANTFNWTAAHTFKTNIGTSGASSTTPTAVITLSPNTAPGSGNYKASPSLVLRAQVNDPTNGLFQTGFRMYTLVGDTSGNATYDLQYNNAFLGSSWTSVFKADQSGNVTIPGTLTQGSYTDITRISAPSNPSSGSLRLFANNSTGKLGCLDSSGVNCFPSATVGVAESYLPIPSSGLLAWWDVSKLGAAEGESQPTLTDQSGNGYDLTSSGSNRPTYTRTQAGSFPALYFDGTDDGMSNGSIATDRRSLTTISVIRPLRSGTQNAFLALGSNQFRLQHKDTVAQLYNGSSYLFSALSGSQIPVYDDWQIITTTHDASLSYAYRGPYTFADAALSAGSMTGAALGRDDASSTFFRGYVAEVIVYNRVLSLTERMQVEARLRAKYGIETKPDTQSDLVAFIGNSLFTSFNLSADTDGVPAQTNKAIDYPFKTKNFGIGNFATPQLTSVTAHANYINSYFDTKRRKNVAVVWEVTNDLVNNSASATTAYNNLVSYCQALQTAGWKVVVMTVLHRSNDATLNGKIDTVNASIRTNWPTFADALADPAGVANLSNETNTTYFQADQVHLTAAGNTEVKTVLAPQVLKLLTPASLASKLWLPAAGCVNTTAGSMWDLPTSSAAAAACVTGTNVQKGVLDYADTSGGFSAQNTLALPSDWTSNVLPDVQLYWTTSATSGNAKWTVTFVCTDVGASATDDPAFPTSGNGFNTVTTAAPGTANRVQTSTITSATLPSSCVSGTKSLLHLKVFRDGNDAADTISATARLIGAELTFRRAF